MVDLAAVVVLALLAATIVGSGYYLYRWVRARRRGAETSRLVRGLLIGLGYLVGLIVAVLVVAFLLDPY
jgi:formate/nitrite transporter FocA (FNT family)